MQPPVNVKILISRVNLRDPHKCIYHRDLSADEVGQYQQQCSALSAKLDFESKLEPEVKSRMKAISSLIESSETEVAAADKRFLALEEQLRHERAKCATLQDRIRGAQVRIFELENRPTSEDFQNLEIELKARPTAAEFDQTKRQIEQLYSALTATRSERDSRINELHARISFLQLQPTEDQLEQANGQIEQLCTDLNTVRGEYNAHTNELNAQIQALQLRPTRDQLEQAKGQIEQLRTKLTNVRDEYGTEIHELDAQIQILQLRPTQDELNLNKQQLQLLTSRMYSNAAEYSNQIGQLGAHIQALELRPTRGELDQAEEQVEQLSSRLTYMRRDHATQIEQLDARINDLRLRPLSYQLDEANSRAAAADQSAAHWRSEAGRQAKACEELNTSLKDVRVKSANQTSLHQQNLEAKIKAEELSLLNELHAQITCLKLGSTQNQLEQANGASSQDPLLQIKEYLREALEQVRVFARASTKVKELESCIDGANQARDLAKASCNHLQSAVQRLEQQVAAKTTTVSEMRSTITENDTRMIELRAQLGELNTKISELETSNNKALRCRNGLLAFIYLRLGYPESKYTREALESDVDVAVVQNTFDRLAECEALWKFKNTVTEAFVFETKRLTGLLKEAYARVDVLDKEGETLLAEVQMLRERDDESQKALERGLKRSHILDNNVKVIQADFDSCKTEYDKVTAWIDEKVNAGKVLP